MMKSATRQWRLARAKPEWLMRAGLVTCAALALALLVIARASAPNPNTARSLVGRPAPAFSLPAAQSGAMLAAPITFNAHGRPTLLVFFNTLCVHCLSEIAAVERATVNADVRTVLVDTPGENAQITGAYLARLRLDPPALLDRAGNVARAYGVSYTPTLALVDQRGIVLEVWVGETPQATVAAALDSIGAS
ncbi:MAG TPA: TlpA disulfide reductase family protein [Ktedonobacterales bacterium]